MTDRDAFLRSIAAAPDDDLPRLVYADWCEELGTDRELATADFVRLTCGRPEPKYKRPRYRKCRACEGKPLFGTDGRPVACPVCDDKGKVGVNHDGPPVRMYPKPAADWLEANWRRLVPALAAGYDHERAKVVVAQAAAVEATPSAVWGSLAEVREAVRSGGLVPHATWLRRGHLKAGVPFVLPLRRHDPAERVCTATVELSFSRGFVTEARWKTPTLGEKIAAAVFEDQPLAYQSGPHSKAHLLMEATRGEER